MRLASHANRILVDQFFISNINQPKKKSPVIVATFNISYVVTYIDDNMPSSHNQSKPSINIAIKLYSSISESQQAMVHLRFLASFPKMGIIF